VAEIGIGVLAADRGRGIATPDGGGKAWARGLPHSRACSGRWPRATRRGSRSAEGTGFEIEGVLRQSVIRLPGRAIDQYMLAEAAGVTAPAPRSGRSLPG